MAALLSEINLPGMFELAGTSNVSYHEHAGTGIPGNLSNLRHIQCDQPVHFIFNWKATGMMTGMIDPACKWELTLYFEKFGGTEFSFPAGIGTTTQAYGSGPYSWSKGILIPANVVDDGVYDVVAVLRIKNAAGVPGPVAAFAEFARLEFYKVVP
jgi:hypothetical protein